MRDLRLGALLVDSGLVKPQWILRANTLSSYTGLPIGKCLILLGCIQEEELRAAVEAQSMLKDNLLEAESLSHALTIVRRKQWPLADALVSLGIDAHFVRGTRLGELLHQAGRLDENRLNFALSLGDYSGLPLGRVLLLLHEIAPTILDSALRTQREVRGGLIERSAAVELLQHNFESEIREAIRENGGIRFGELFVNADVLSESEVETAVSEARRSGKMLGQYLLDQNRISESLLIAAVNLQDLIWKAEVTLDQASDVLSGINNLKLSVSDGFSRIGLTYSCIGKNLTLCDFLRASGYLTREVLEDFVSTVKLSPAFDAYNRDDTRDISAGHLREVIKSGLRNQEFLVYYLNKTSPIDSDLINSAVVLHELVQSGKMRMEQAVLQFNLRKLEGNRKAA